MAALPHRASDTIAEMRESLRSDRLALEQSFLQQGKAARLLSAHSRLIDQYLRRVWQQLAMPQQIALVAVGGYGRGELYPRSDIDLLILLDAEPDAALQQKLHDLIGMLWDIGLEVGHSIRTVAQCLSESADITVQTNLLEARQLTGNAVLYGELRDAMTAKFAHHTVTQRLDETLNGMADVAEIRARLDYADAAPQRLISGLA